MKHYILAICGCLILSGCVREKEFEEVNQTKPVKVDENAHVHTAPHGGQLIELGDHQYNAELVLADKKPLLTIYLLGAHAEVPVAIEDKTLTLKVEVDEKEQELTFKANPMEKDPEGKSSRFELDAETSPLKSLDHVHASLSVKFGDESFSGSLGHDHDHGHDHGEDHDDHDDHDHGKEKNDKEKKEEK